MASDEKTNPPSFLSLPEDIILSCLARISKSYYPKLSLVSKSFRSILSSKDLLRARFHLKTRENCVYVCLQSSTDHNPSWFSLWIKPGTTVTKTLLVPIPSSSSPPSVKVEVGSKIYEIGDQNVPSSVMRVRNKMSYDNWSEAPSMKVARKNALACVSDEKIYVMGGCNEEESTNWAEVFDTKTQTWDILPDPGVEVRCSLISKVEVCYEKLFLRVEKKRHVYNLKYGNWRSFESKFYLQNHKLFYVSGKKCFSFDINHEMPRTLIDFSNVLDKYDGNSIVHIVNYGEKLLMIWECLEPCDLSNKKIWCTMISLERGKGGEVWGKLEWDKAVLTVPRSHVFLRCLVNLE